VKIERLLGSSEQGGSFGENFYVKQALVEESLRQSIRDLGKDLGRDQSFVRVDSIWHLRFPLSAGT
jgi:hypothetical protein